MTVPFKHCCHRLVNVGDSYSRENTEVMVATFDNVRVNQLSGEATDWLRSVVAALDAKDVDAYTGFMADDVEVLFNNGEMSMRGRDSVREGLAQYWQGFDSLRHEELNIYGTDRNFVHEALNHFTTLDGRDVTLRAVAWIDRNDAGEVTSLRVYSDQSSLFEPGDDA